jgi:hypothetical protein
MQTPYISGTSLCSQDIAHIFRALSSGLMDSNVLARRLQRVLVPIKPSHPDFASLTAHLSPTTRAECGGSWVPWQKVWLEELRELSNFALTDRDR